MSSSPRRLGRPVSESVDARRSASERLRRLASTGAAWVTESWMRCVSAVGDRALLGDEHGADDLAADEQRLAHRLPGAVPQTSQVEDLVAVRRPGARGG